MYFIFLVMNRIIAQTIAKHNHCAAVISYLHRLCAIANRNGDKSREEFMTCCIVCSDPCSSDGHGERFRRFFRPGHVRVRMVQVRTCSYQQQLEGRFSAPSAWSSHRTTLVTDYRSRGEKVLAPECA